MYFKSVNRGISFTKSGTYTLCFVMLLGVLAAASGYNALFLALAFGSGLLITSGLLSERSIKPLEIAGNQKTFAEADSEFRLKLIVKNANAKVPLFGSEIVVSRGRPRFRTFHPQLATLGACHFLRLFAGEEKATLIPCGGLKRGVYNEVPLVLRTIYPFGLISKFKVDYSPAPIVVYPRVDAAFQNELLHELRTATLPGDSQPEFHSHRSYMPEDSARKIDWKKSAGKRVSDWAVKVHVRPAESFQFLVVPEWPSAKVDSTQERFLSRVLTACETLAIQAPHVLLRLPEPNAALQGIDAIREYLAAYPGTTAPAEARVLPQNRYLALVVSTDHHRWESANE